MFIEGLTNADAMPVLEAAATVAAQRNRFIQNNIANFSTPNYEPTDVNVRSFQEDLGEAIDRRRKKYGGMRGELRIKESAQLKHDGPGGLRIIPQASGRNIMFHDRNNRDLERTMQDLTENTAAFRVATEFLRAHTALLQSAISERP